MRYLLCTVLCLSLVVSFSEECKIETKITGDFPKGEEIYPKVVLNGKDIHGNFFSPGKYEAEISCPGYESLTKDIVIAKQQKLYILKEILTTKKRKIKFDISLDIPSISNDYKVRVAVFSRRQKSITINDGDFLKPDCYLFTISKPGYHTINVKMYVWPTPSEKEFVIENRNSFKELSKDRSLVFNCVNDDNTIVAPYFVRKGNKAYDSKEMYATGDHIRLSIAFKNYKTIDVDEIIPPGAGPHIVDILLHKLQSIEFQLFHTKKL